MYTRVRTSYSRAYNLEVTSYSLVQNMSHGVVTSYSFSKHLGRAIARYNRVITSYSRLLSS